jgi:hypothetical protein
MGMAHRKREGILILRAWVEASQAEAPRIRIIQVVDRNELPVAAVASVDEACAIVRRWFDELLGQDRGCGPSAWPPLPTE